jgi:RNA polymerase sigma factor (sigma-70 family)
MTRITDTEAHSFWNLIIQRYYNKVLNFVFHSTHDYFRAEDITQEAFARAIHHFRQLKDPDKFFPWVISIALNVIRKQSQSSGRTVLMDTDIFPDRAAAVSDPEHILNQEETSRRVLNAIHKLSSQEKNVVLMRYYLDMKEKDIAFALGVTRGTVKKLLFRGRAKLYENLDNCFSKEGEEQ